MGFTQHCLLSVTAAMFAMASANCSAMDADAQAKALMTISEFAEKICNTVPAEGGNNSLQLNGKAKAQLSGVVKKLADLGIEGSAQYSSNEYKSVLQSDLAKALKDNAACKAHVFELLNEKMISGPSVGNIVHGNNNVVSTGQLGGITANTVNIAPLNGI